MEYSYLHLLIMKEITIKNTHGDSLTILPDLGTVLKELHLDGQSVIKFPLNPDDLKKGFPSALLFPFPNRVKDGTYSFDGKNYRLNRNELGRSHAIHGLVAHEPFEIIEQGKTHVTARFTYDGTAHEGYPFPYTFEVKYTLKKNTLVLEYEAINTGSTSMPCGFGWHPYFQLEDLKVGDLQLDIPARHAVELDEGLIPIETNEEIIASGEISLRNTILDNVFKLADNEAKTSVVKLSSPTYRLEIKQERGINKLNYFILYTPPIRDCIAIEPQTSNTNCFNNGEGLILLAPQEKLQGKIEVSLHKI